MANWQSFVVKVPGKDLLEPVDNVLETLVVLLDVLKAILDTVKTFLIDFGNPIRALVEALIKLIEELFLSLKQTGFFGYFDVPDPTTDPNFDRFSGGFQSFTERFKGSLFDSKDFNRPQPRPGSTQSGFVLLVVDASTPYGLLARMKQLLRFFSREFSSPRFAAPENLKALPVGASGDPILKVATIFGLTSIGGIELQWSLPSTVQTPDPGFSDVVTRVAAEFIPPKYVIERSVVNPAAAKIDIAALASADSAGLVEFNRSTFIDVANMTQPVVRRQTLTDEYGDPVVKFQKYIFLDNSTTQLITAQLGTYRYVDQDVAPNTTYYYRIRAYSGELKNAGHQILFPTFEQLTFSPEYGSPVMAWPSAAPGESVVIGKASGLVSASVPDLSGVRNFDVLEDLRRLFLASFTLDFHLQADSSSTFTPTGQPSGSTSPIQVGRGSMANLAASIGAFESFPIVGDLRKTQTVSASFQPDPITGLKPLMPWQSKALRKQASRLADATASALLQAGTEALNGFRSLMQDPLPAGPIGIGLNLTAASTLEKVVLAFTALDEDGNVPLNGAQTFVDGYQDTGLRLNVLAGIQYVKTYSLGGAPVDWIAVVPLRDIIPWSGQLIYDLIAKIQALLDGFKGVMDEIRAFIDLLERKIDALERFIEFLINILNFIESLQIGAYILSVPELNGSAQAWVNAIDTAGGTKPPSGPGGYSGGVGLAYVATDISAFKAAFSVIFG
jgi:hypothetical protein